MGGPSLGRVMGVSPNRHPKEPGRSASASASDGTAGLFSKTCNPPQVKTAGLGKVVGEVVGPTSRVTRSSQVSPGACLARRVREDALSLALGAEPPEG